MGLLFSVPFPGNLFAHTVWIQAAQSHFPLQSESSSDFDLKRSQKSMIYRGSRRDASAPIGHPAEGYLKSQQSADRYYRTIPSNLSFIFAYANALVLEEILTLSI